MRLEFKNNNIIINDTDGNIFNLHPMWLRERCEGEDFVDPTNLQRLYEPSNIDINIKIKKIKMTNNDTIVVEFTDGCIGKFVVKKILKEFSKIDIIPSQISWMGNMSNFSKYSFNKKFKDSKEMLSMLKDFCKYGFAIIYNVPAKKNAVIEFAEIIGTIRSTNFGKLFNVVSEKKPYDLAYTPMRLSAHTDNPYRKPVPGIQLLHCIVNDAKGGISGLIDGLTISEELKKIDKEAYDVITSTKVRFNFTGSDIILENWGELIELDENKKFKQIRFSGRLDYVPALKSNKLELFYRGRKILSELLNDEKFELSFKLDKGMLMIFDNHRLLHSRTAYDPTTGNRHLQGCYIEHDSVDGKIRYLDKKLNNI